MSPKVSRPGGEPDKTGLPPGHVPMRPPARPKPEPRKPISLWWKLGGYVALLAATVVTILYLAQPEDPRSSPQGTAELVAKALTDGDISAFQSYLCGGVLESPGTWANLGTTTVLGVSHDEDKNENNATAWLKGRGIRDIKIALRNKNGLWCVVGVTF